MNMSMIAQLNARRWNGLVLGFIVAVMVHLTAATNAGRSTSRGRCCCRASQSASIRTSRCLHQRAHGSLEKLVQSARAPEQPL